MVRDEAVLKNEEMVKIKKLARRIILKLDSLMLIMWNILNGQDRNFDGKVDIDDKMIEAEEKANANKKN